MTQDGNAKPESIGILGAGCMGRGIAQVAATHGHPIHILDIDRATAEGGIQAINQRLDRMVAKGRLTAEERAECSGRLLAASSPSDLCDCSLIIEAVSENLAVKTAILSQVIPATPSETVLATNTSSLSVTELAHAIGEPTRTLGLHFFNPAPLQPLVELISTSHIDLEVVSRAEALARSWGKTVVHSADSPGFIVNRVARPFYLEAWRILEEGLATVDQIDQALRGIAGFPMGPFQLMDYLGHDLSLEVTNTLYIGSGRQHRFTPSGIQQQLVKAGSLGRKTDLGAYDYSTDPPTPAVNVKLKSLSLPAETIELLDRFTGRALTHPPESTVQQYIIARILACIINEACHVVDEHVATGKGIDTAMKLGTKHPRGPFEWLRSIGPDLCISWLNELTLHTGFSRYTSARFLLNLIRTEGPHKP
ncbi:MAG: 3-hydroxyacyl-CoA dehydrogenase [Planctomycetes bacterium]|nr:3-hydroxyacyl-CoA dehydrogenase [Planctomycetota bacterium]NOG53718.1 3-hydroxyacyl-CoA dehydrogenase [Planctomycetota bacterium]